MSYEKELINKLKQPNEEFESYLERARKFADEIKEKDEWLWFILLQSMELLAIQMAEQSLMNRICSIVN